MPKLIDTELPDLKNNLKEVAMERKRILVAVCVFFCFATNVFSGEAVGPDTIRDKLLKADGWIAEWRGYGYEGAAETIFEEREGKTIAIIHNVLNPDQNCERPVTITPEGFKMDGCTDTDISLVFDPADREYPFKGESKNCYYKFKVK